MGAAIGLHADVPPVRSAYGDDAAQYGELYRPSGPTQSGTVVVIHGGFWRARYDLSLGRPLARDLAERGYSAWNLEYRRVGGGGGWPGTFEDVAAGIDHLADLDVDTARVVAIGHSAGGQLAVWAAGRAKLPAGVPGAAPRVRLTGVIAQAGVLDLGTAAETHVGHGAVVDLLGGTPRQEPLRYAGTDPIGQVPLDAEVLCVHARSDQDVPFAQSTAYVAAATAAGGRASLHEAAGDHYTLIDPDSPDWRLTVDALPGMLAG
jgi:acetyl esterase/lipase